MSEQSHSRWRPGASAGSAHWSDATSAETLAQIVYDVRTALGLTAQQAAQRCAMTDSEYDAMESGGTAPTPLLLARLRATLGPL
jgi:ribosome-binding protein aMBF1 (putative translation factor)